MAAEEFVVSSLNECTTSPDYGISSPGVNWYRIDRLYDT